MSDIPAKYTPKANFWESNGQFLTIGIFKDFYKKDKSKNKKDSSELMWAIAFIYDKDSEHNSLPEDERIALITEEFLERKPQWDKYEDVINAYIKLTTSTLERAIIDMEKKFWERNKFLQDTGYTEKNSDKLDKMFTNTGSILDSIEKLKKLLDQEKDGTTRGGIEESASEKGEI